MSEPFVSLSTRVSPEVMQVLDNAVKEMGCTQRAAVEYAIRAAYGHHQEPEEDPEEALERRKTETKAAYVAAVQELFALLGMPDSQKGPDHKAEVMAANNKCGELRVAMIAAWEGEEEYSWPR